MSVRDKYRERYDQDLPPDSHKFKKTLPEIIDLLKTEFSYEQQSENWEERLHAIKQLRKILRTSADIDVQDKNFWIDLRISLCKHISNESRLPIQLQALVTSCMFIEEAPVCRNYLCAETLDACFQLFRVKSKPLAQDAWTVTTIIVQQQHTKNVFNRIMFYADSNAHQDRKRVVECLNLVVKRWPRQILEIQYGKQTDNMTIRHAIIENWKRSSVDRDSAVRETAKILWKTLDKEFPGSVPEMPNPKHKNRALDSFKNKKESKGSKVKEPSKLSVGQPK